MFRRITTNRVAATVAITLSVLLVAGLVEACVHLYVVRLSDIQAHLMSVTLIGILIAVISWIGTGRVEELNRLLKRQELRRQVQAINQATSEERTATHQATMRATFHYLNNTINQFTLMLTVIEDGTELDSDTITEIKRSLYKTVQDLKALGELEDPTDNTVQKFLKSRL